MVIKNNKAKNSKPGYIASDQQMTIVVDADPGSPASPPVVGNVYPCRGGRGARYGHMMILFAITEPRDQFEDERCIMLVIDRDGNPRGCQCYAKHYIDRLIPFAYAEGISDINLTITSI